MASVSDVLKANVVLVGLGLLRDLESVSAFSERVGSDVLLDDVGLTVGVPVGKKELPSGSEMQRERISVKMLPDRTVIEREFPSRSDLRYLGQVLEKASETAGAQQRALRAYGYNIEVVFGQISEAPSLKYLGARLFGKSEFVPANWSVVGAMGQLYFDSPMGRWTIQLEPRFNDPNGDRVFMSLNLHKEEHTLPDAGSVRQSLESVWDQAHDIVARLDGGAR